MNELKSFKKIRTVRPSEVKAGMFITPVFSRSSGKKYPSIFTGEIYRVIDFSYPVLVIDAPIKGASGGLSGIRSYDWRSYEFKRVTKKTLKAVLTPQSPVTTI